MEELDLAFIVDETGIWSSCIKIAGSMGAVIAHVKKTVVDICSTVEKIFPKLNTALVLLKYNVNIFVGSFS